jgi:hypothetical protein
MAEAGGLPSTAARWDLKESEEEGRRQPLLGNFQQEGGAHQETQSLPL